MKLKYKHMIFLFLFAFALRMLFYVFIQVRYWDETVYLSLAKDLSVNFFHYSLAGAGWSDFIPFGHFPYSWPNIGFRAPLLPYTLSLFYMLKISFLSKIFIPIVSAINSVLVYLLGKKMFNIKTGLYSGILFSLIPLNLLWGFRVSTGIYGIFFLLLSFLFFWKGFEEGDKKSKIFFGIFLALAVLARYTILIVIPVFLIYFLIRDKSLRFLKDKYLWFAILSFLVVMAPWFIYGINFYSNPLGPFLFGTTGSNFWGGIQPIYFYLQYFYKSFSIIGIFFVVSLIYFFKKRLFVDKKIYLMLIWFFFFLVVTSLIGHKEQRFLLPLIPVLAILSGFFISNVKWKKIKYHKLIILVVLALYILSFVIIFSSFYRQESSGTNYCFSKSLDFLKSQKNVSLVYSDESPIVYSVTGYSTRFYPNHWNQSLLKKEKGVYIIYTDYDKPLYLEDNVQFREDLKENFNQVFSCDKSWGITEIYKAN